MKDTTLITKEDWAMFPKVFTTRYFNNDDDKRDVWNEIYAVENVVNNIDEEREFCESVNHQANLVIEIKFANGKIK
jgi:hypothetical protein